MARKLLSLVVALAVVLSSMSFAFAADPKAVSADVTDVKVKTAVEKLVAFGMVEGIDGKYVPDQKLKRSELTKLIVMALGLGPAAEAAKGATQFSDVGADHWASGYITVAAGQGIVQGMGDGTFSPDAEVTFAQALTMLVRTLGYKDEFLKGVWPGNYLAKASEKGIYAGVTITPNGAVKRGDFAVMMSNCLDAKVVEVSSYKDTEIAYAENPQKTLLKDKMKLDKIEVRPVANARIGSVGTDKVTLKFMKTYTSDSDGVESSVAKALDAEEDYTLASGVSADNLMGVATYAYYSKDSQKIVYFEQSGKSEVVWDGVDKFTDYDGSTVSPDIKLRWTGKTFQVKGGSKLATADNRDDLAIVYLTANGTTSDLIVNGKYAREYMVSSNSDIQYFGRFVVEGGKVVFADLYDYESNKRNLLVKSVDAEKAIITYYDAAGNEANINLASTYSGGYYINDKSGAVMKLSELKQWDVVSIAKSTVDSKDYANIFLFRQTKKGTVVALSSDAAKAAGKVELDGGIGWTDFGRQTTFSKDDNATIEAEPSNTILNDFYNTSVVLIIDNNKKVRHIYGTTTASSNLYGIIKAVESATIDKKVKLYLPSDESVLYSFEDQDKFIVGGAGTNDFTVLRDTFEAASNSSDPVLMKYKLTKDGKIAKNSVILYTANGTSTSTDGLAFHIDVTKDFGETTINTDSDSYYATKDIKLFDVFGVTGYSGLTSNLTDLEVANWDNFKNKDVASGSHLSAMVVVDSSNKKNVNAMVLISDFGAASKDVKSAYIINKLTIDGDPYGWFAVYGESELKRYKIDQDNFFATSGVVKEAAVMINITSAGKATLYANANAASTASGKAFATVAGRVYAVDAANITIGTNSSTYKYQIASDAVVYVGDAAKTVSSIDVDDVVVAVMKNGVIQSVELVDVKQVQNDKTFGSYSASQPSDLKITANYTKPGVTNAYYVASGSMSTAAGASTFFINPDGKVAGVIQ